MQTRKHITKIACAIALAAASTLGGCSAPPSNEVLFGIQQSAVGSSGEESLPRVTALYEVLHLDGKGRRRETLEGGECYLEDPSTRVGDAPGVNTGVAVFRGAALPPDGLSVFPEHTGDRLAVHEGRGWEGGERLYLRAGGFPGEPTLSLNAPFARMVIRAPRFDDASLRVSPTREMRVEWAPVPSRVIVRLATTEPGERHRLLDCFFDGGKGVGIIPASAVARLPVVDGTNVTGELRIATHTQSYTDEEDWRISVVATTVHVRRPFVTATPGE